jgi:hypothetical protein
MLSDDVNTYIYSAPTHLCVTVWGGFQMLAPRKTRIFLGVTIWQLSGVVSSSLNPTKTAKKWIKINEKDEKDEDEILMYQAGWLISS